jgi:hypothetical protein
MATTLWLTENDAAGGDPPSGYERELVCLGDTLSRET